MFARSFLLAVLLTGASAFAPTNRATSRTSIVAAPKAYAEAFHQAFAYGTGDVTPAPLGGVLYQGMTRGYSGFGYDNYYQMARYNMGQGMGMGPYRSGYGMGYGGYGG